MTAGELRKRDLERCTLSFVKNLLVDGRNNRNKRMVISEATITAFPERFKSDFSYI
jgi:hypothetical protein